MFEKATDKVTTSGALDSRIAFKVISSLVLLTIRSVVDGRPSGKADENAHSSSSAAGAGVGAFAAWDARGLGFAKSNMEPDC